MSSALNLFAGNALVTLGIVAGGIALYDRQVVRPAQRVAVVDVGEVYRLKEAEFSRLLTGGNTGGGSEAERDKALALARDFSQRLPQALEELPRECGCLVLLKSALAGPTPQTLDLTPQLRLKLQSR